MRNKFISLAAALCVGLAAGFLSYPYIHRITSSSVSENRLSTEPATPTIAVEVRRIKELEQEIEEYKIRLAEAKRQLEDKDAVSEKAAEPKTPEENGNAKNSHVSEVTQNDAVRWKISAIEKFVPLSEDEKRRLRESFSAKSKGEEGETLDQILGEENARYYRQQVQSAFKRMQEQELEKELLYTSRRLQLSPDQELRLRSVFQTIENEISAQPPNSEESPKERVARMVAEGKRRISLRAERAKEVLTPQQYQVFLKDEAESPEADMQVFHDSGESSKNSE